MSYLHGLCGTVMHGALGGGSHGTWCR